MHKLFFESALTPDGWRDRVLVTIESGIVTAVSPDVGPLPDGVEPMNGIAVAGLPNLHSHTFQRGFAGLAERRGSEADHFWTWREAMYGLALRLSPEDVEAIAAMAFVEMLEGGFTSVAEFHYLHHAPDGQPYAEPAELAGRIVAAAARTGIGLTLLPVHYAQGGFGGAPPTPGQRRFVTSLDLYERILSGAAAALKHLPGARLGIAPHSLRAVTGSDLRSLVAAHPTGPVHIHAAEQIREVEECRAATGSRPVEWLLDHVGLDPRWCLIHATHMTEAETRRLAASGAVAGLCPVTESNLGDGISPATDYLAAGGAFGIGTDSNVLISAATELRTLDYSQRLRDRARNRLAPDHGSSGRRLHDGAVAGGARALGGPAPAIAPGSPADIVVLDSGAIELHARREDARLDALIFASARSPITAVMAAGSLCVRDGRHRGRTSVEAEFRRVLDRLAR